MSDPKPSQPDPAEVDPDTGTGPDDQPVDNPSGGLLLERGSRAAVRHGARSRPRRSPATGPQREPGRAVRTAHRVPQPRG